MKKFLTVLLMILLMGFANAALAGSREITVYVSPGILEDGEAKVLMQLLSQAVPELSFVQTGEDIGGLWAQVIRGEQPDIAICTAQEAEGCAREGLLLPLDLQHADIERVEETVLHACKTNGVYFMTPLFARHRRMAVNRRYMEELEIAALTDKQAFPVWQVMQLYQVLEEAALFGGCAMEIWPAANGEGDALFAFIQALYGGVFAEPDQGVLMDLQASAAGLEWLLEMVECGWIKVAQSRDEALKHFLDGETALFIDWTVEEMKRCAASEEGRCAYIDMPYPSSLGIPVRDAQIVGMAAFATDDPQLDALLTEAVKAVLRDERLERVLGGRAIFKDDALWLAFPGANGGGNALRGLMGAVIDSAIAGEIDAHAAMRLVKAAVQESMDR